MRVSANYPFKQSEGGELQILENPQFFETLELGIPQISAQKCCNRQKEEYLRHTS